jgi:hypothetical protein
MCLPAAVDAQDATRLQAPTNLRLAKSPYQHIVPSDVGVTIGPGVTGPVPTAVWSGSTTISDDGTVIENVVVNGCLDIYANDVTIRNVVVNCGGLYSLDIRGNNVLVEYSKIQNTTSAKNILMKSPTNGRIWRNEIQGGMAFFYIEGDVEGLVVEDNYMHTVVGNPLSHTDGFQIGEASDTYGNMLVRGNYIWENNENVGSTDVVFVTNYSRLTLVVENNFFLPWGRYTLRCTDAAYCIGRNNVYSLDFLTEVDYGLKLYGMDEFYCNRFENGEFLDTNLGDDSICPAFADY